MQIADRIEHGATPSAVTRLQRKTESSTGPLAALGKMIRILRSRSRVRKMLDLDDHILRDIGIERGDVQWALMTPWHVDPTERLKIVRTERMVAARCTAYRK